MTIERLKKIELDIKDLGHYDNADAMPNIDRPKVARREEEIHLDCMSINDAIDELRRYADRTNPRISVEHESNFGDDRDVTYVVWDEVESMEETAKRQKQERHLAYLRWQNNLTNLITQREALLNILVGKDEAKRLEVLAAAHGYRLVKE
jgi:hypothetical protein